MTATTTPTPEQIEDLLLSCRYGELEEVKVFVERFGAEAVVKARDDRGNTAVHMCCGNGHVGESDRSSLVMNTLISMIYRRPPVLASQLARFAPDDDEREWVASSPLGHPEQPRLDSPALGGSSRRAGWWSAPPQGKSIQHLARVKLDADAAA